MSRRGHRAAGALTGLLVACFTFVGAAAPTTPASLDFLPMSRADGVALLRSATHRVMSFGCAAANNGTAVQLADGTIVTAAHVVAGTRLINLVPDLGPTAIGTARVSATHDVAVVRQPGSHTAKGVELAPEDPVPGVRVLMAGYPNGQLSLDVDDAVVDGWIDGRTVGQPGPVLRLRRSATTGMSGGPVLDPAGRLAGILFATRTGDTQTFAIPASTIRAVLAARDTLRPTGHC